MGRPSLEDRHAIEDLFVRYTVSLDSYDTEGVIACFIEDCALSTPIHGDFVGHDGIREWMKPNLALQERGGQLRHVISNFVMDVEGDHARVKAYLLDYVTMKGEKPVLLSPGVYDCDLVKRDGAWLCARRRVDMDYVFTLPGG